MTVRMEFVAEVETVASAYRQGNAPPSDAFDAARRVKERDLSWARNIKITQFKDETPAPAPEKVTS